MTMMVDMMIVAILRLMTCVRWGAINRILGVRFDHANVEVMLAAIITSGWDYNGKWVSGDFWFESLCTAKN